MHHKRRRPKHQRSGCLWCKPHKDERRAKLIRLKGLKAPRRIRSEDETAELLQKLRSHPACLREQAPVRRVANSDPTNSSAGVPSGFHHKNSIPSLDVDR